MGIVVQVHGVEHKGHCLYVSNHRSLLDPLIELGYIDTFILSKAEVANYPLLGSGARRTGVLFVERTSEESRKAAIQSIEKLFSSGSSVLIYPEGTTNGGNLTAEFRKGTIELAFRLGIPVIPVMIEYPDSSYYWTTGSLMDYFHRIFSKPMKHRVNIQIGD
ncbi:MAG: lysophospholipid acyltransferase family protein, partial [Saprospiraceae bacterium]